MRIYENANESMNECSVNAWITMNVNIWVNEANKHQGINDLCEYMLTSKEGMNVNEWMNECECEWMSGCEWMHECEWMNVNEWMDGCEWMNKWLWMNGWMWMNADDWK